MASKTNNHPCSPTIAALALLIIAAHALVWGAEAAGECGRVSIRSAAASLAPCLSAVGNARAKVPPACCSTLSGLNSKAPKCICAILLSPLAKQAGVKPEIALTVPKRCGIKNRHSGKKCGSKYWFLKFILHYYITATDTVTRI